MSLQRLFFAVYFRLLRLLYSLLLVPPMFVIYLNNAFRALIFHQLLTNCYFVDNQHVTNGIANTAFCIAICRLLQCERRQITLQETANGGGVNRCRRSLRFSPRPRKRCAAPLASGKGGRLLRAVSCSHRCRQQCVRWWCRAVRSQQCA